MKTFIISLLAFQMSFLSAQSIFTSNESISVTNPDAKAEMEWTAEKHDFGQIPQGTAVDVTFEVYNSGNADLMLESVKPSCQCTVADYTQTPIKPGESGWVKASYSAKNIGHFSKSVTVKTNAEPGHMVLRMKGEVISK